jgi:hypothetical protein
MRVVAHLDLAPRNQNIGVMVEAFRDHANRAGERRTRQKVFELVGLADLIFLERPTGKVFEAFFDFGWFQRGTIIAGVRVISHDEAFRLSYVVANRARIIALFRSTVVLFESIVAFKYIEIRPVLRYDFAAQNENLRRTAD